VRILPDPDASVAASAGERGAAGVTADGAARAPSDGRRRALARGILREATGALPSPLDIVLAGEPGWDEPIATGRARIVVRDPAALGRLLWPPTPEGLAEGYLRGDLDIVGDIASVIGPAEGFDLRRLGPAGMRRVVRWGLELRQGSEPAPTLQRFARLRGPVHSQARDLEAIRFHYDVGNDFFRLWLDRRLTYSSAYFASPDDPIDAAQDAKLDLICRKLALQPGRRLLDIGCGWGSLIGFAAERHGVAAVGVTLSERQAAYANATADERGWAARAQVRDYRDLEPLGTFHAIASVGMFEHVGRANLGTYFAAAHAAMRPGGLFLNHGIASAAPGQSGPRGSFVDRYVFPDGELVPIEDTLRAARAAGFEVIDVESLRPHYALTLAAWVRGLEAHWDAAVAAAGEEVARTWRLYMTAARLGFEHGDLDVFQMLLARPAEDGPASRPLRPWWR
jgi:cyclopropane-fatty-acyl-phospholipid synthase